MADPASWQGILVPLDGSATANKALLHASAIGRRLGVPLIVVMVVDKESEVAAARHTLHRHLNNLSQHVDDAQVIAADTVAAGIVNHATAGNLAVVMSSHGHGRLSAMALGSVAIEVLTRLHGPAIVVGPKCVPGSSHDLAQLVVCVDGTPHTEPIVAVASELARRARAVVRLVSVVPPTTTVFDLFEETAAPTKADRDRYLQQLAASLRNGLSVTAHVLSGRDVARTIVTHLGPRPGSIVALATHGRSGFARLTLGSVAQRVVRESPHPVLLCPTE